MRIWAFFAVFAVTVAQGCGDNGNNTGDDQCDCPDDGNPCNGTESCATGACRSSGNLADGVSCGAGKVCQAGACSIASVKLCGNGKVDDGEDCDGGDGCTDDCAFVCSDSPATQCADEPVGFCQVAGCAADHTCAAVADRSKNGMACDAAVPGAKCNNGFCNVCGNGVRDPGEECDDHNVLNLDGCDSSCKLEQAARLTSLLQQFAPGGLCDKNALGAAITMDAQETIQATWDAPILDGSLSIVFKFLGLDQVLGPTTDSPFQLGFVNAAPVPPPDGATYDGTTDLDWWYVREPGSVDASEVPKVKLAGRLDHGHITAGPGTISLKLLFALSPAQVTLYHSVVDARIDGPVGTPMVATADAPRGHLASEHLDPALQTFTTSSVGAMCSDVSVQSLFDTPIPDLLQAVCTEDDGQTPFFSLETNKLLDLFVAGCKVFGLPGFVTTQPDGSLDGAIYHFDADPVTHTVATCTRDGAPAVLADCLAQATYSSSFKFTSDRVVIHRE